MVTNNSYKIARIEDLFVLDDRQLDACLSDLKTFVLFNRNNIDTINKMRKQMIDAGVPEETANNALRIDMVSDGMEWVDDGLTGGKVNASLNVRKGDGTIVELGRATVDIGEDGLVI